MEFIEVVEKLKKIALFSDFADDNEKLLKVYKLMKIEKYSSGSSIINEGDMGDKLFILNKGTVKILRNTLNNEKYAVALLSSDDNIFFGELALIDNDKRSATVIAESDCEVLSIHQDQFMKLCEENPLMGFKITLKIAKRLSGTLRKMNKDVIVLFEALVGEVEGDF